jgi:hypothetical protein
VVIEGVIWAIKSPGGVRQGSVQLVIASIPSGAALFAAESKDAKQYR